MGKSKGQKFGGDWTNVKLEVIAKYLRAYTTALKNSPTPETPFHKIYIDAFAGTGYRDARRDDASKDQQNLIFPDIAEPGPQALLEGSARMALQIKPLFDEYIFIEQKAASCVHLEELKIEFPHLADAISVQQGDANIEIQSLCVARSWKMDRAVLFLDPFGMQVDWRTIESIAETKAIDLWLLFPLGIGVNRLLTRSGDIPDPWRKRLSAFLGTDDWYDEFYKVEAGSDTLFPQERIIKASMDVIGRYFNNRLKTIFEGVAETPGVLRNSANNPLYLLCFAVGNKNGRPIALNIAEHLLKAVR